MFVRGHVYPQVDKHDWETSFAERPLLFHNLNHGKRSEVMPAVEAIGLADVIPAHGQPSATCSTTARSIW